MTRLAPDAAVECFAGTPPLPSEECGGSSPKSDQGAVREPTGRPVRPAPWLVRRRAGRLLAREARRWGTVAPLKGSLRVEHVRCGKVGCRCARGELHGPYLYLYRGRSDGDGATGVRRGRRRYVPFREWAVAVAGVRLWRQTHPPAWELRQWLAALRREEEAAGR